MVEVENTLLVIDSKPAIRKRCEKALPEWEVLYAREPEKGRELLLSHPGISVLLASPEVELDQIHNPAKEKQSLPALILLTEDKALADQWAGANAWMPIRFLFREGSAAHIRRVVETGLNACRPQPESSSPHREPAGLEENENSVEADRTENAGNLRLSREIRFKEDWVKVVAHDIRSPLTIIKSYADMLLKNDHQMSDQAKLILERIYTSGDWMLELIDNILDLSLIEEGRLELKPAPVALDIIMSSVVERLKMLAENNYVTLDWIHSNDRKLYNLDHLKIEQVLHNLVINGIKFSRPGDRVMISGRKEGELVVFQVEDSGIGLSEEQIEHIFKKFSRESPRQAAGKGLGLAIAKFIVELHGGSLMVKSHPGEGSVFSFTVKPPPA